MSTSKEKNVMFIGPNGEECDSFVDLCICCMDTHCPDWTDSTSYGIPPIFNYKLAQNSDAVFEAEQEGFRLEKSKNKEAHNRFVIDRQSDNAEHHVYEAISHLVQDQYQTPFIALHDLNLNCIKAILPVILTNQISIPKLIEYDFVLIGPKIGLIVIEVKSSMFEKAKDFSPENKLLPDLYVAGLEQLNSIDALLPFLKDGFKLDSLEGTIPVRKILFTPNLEKRRYVSWMSQLEQDAATRVVEKVGQVIQWFKEDMYNSAEVFNGKPPVYGKLHELLGQNNPISKDLNTTYGPLFFGLNSVIRDKTIHGITRIFLNEDKYSLGTSIQIESSRVHAQDAVSKPDSTHFPTEMIRKMTQEITLTAEQQGVLDRQCRRLFIVGPAGVGKTVILLRRALQCLEKNQSVMVIAQASYVEIFKQVFQAQGYKKYEVRDWKTIWTKSPHGGLQPLVDADGFWPREEASRDLYDQLVRKMGSNIGKYERILGDLVKFDHVLIDDAFEQAPTAGRWAKMIIRSLAIMAFVHVANSKTTVWIAADSYGYLNCLLLYEYDGPLNGEPVTENILQTFLSTLSSVDRSNHQSMLCTELLEKYCTVFLPHVMRCSEYVFNTAYDVHGLKSHAIPRQMIPELGHKIQGVPHLRIEREAEDIDDAMKVALFCVQEQLHVLFKQGMRAMDIAVISRVKEGDFVSQRELNECICGESTCSDCWKCGVTYHYYENVSSLEWPVVITFELWPQTKKFGPDKLPFIYKFFKYCAFTRATIQIIEIRVNYSIDDTARFDQQLREIFEEPWNFHDPAPRGEGLFIFMAIRDFQVTKSAKSLYRKKRLSNFMRIKDHPSKEDDPAAGQGNRSGSSTRSKRRTSSPPSSLDRKTKSINQPVNEVETSLITHLIGGLASAIQDSSSALVSASDNAEQAVATESTQDEQYFFGQLVAAKLRRLDQATATRVQRDVLEILHMVETGRQWTLNENMPVDQNRN